MNSSGTQFTLVLFSPSILTFLACFLLFLLSFVLLAEGEGPKCSDSELDSCAIHAYVTLLREGACIMAILPAIYWLVMIASRSVDRHKIHAAT